MNKTELIGCVAEKSGLAKKDAEKAVNAVLDAVVETLKAAKRYSWLALATSKCVNALRARVSIR